MAREPVPNLKHSDSILGCIFIQFGHLVVELICCLLLVVVLTSAVRVRILHIFEHVTGHATSRGSCTMSRVKHFGGAGRRLIMLLELAHLLNAVVHGCQGIHMGWGVGASVFVRSMLVALICRWTCQSPSGRQICGTCQGSASCWSLNQEQKDHGWNTGFEPCMAGP